MPRIPENDALAIAQNIDSLTGDDHVHALDILSRYQTQQADLGEPEWPSQVKAAQDRQNSLRSLYTGGLEKVPFDVSPWSKDPAADKATYANMSFLSARYGKTPQEIADRHDFYRNDYARQYFGQPGGVDDKVFYGLAAGEIQRQQQVDETAMEGAKAALRGEDVIPALQSWQQKNGLERIPDSTEFTKGFLAARGRSGDHLQFADNLLGLLESNVGMTKGNGAERAQPASRETAGQFEESLARLAEMKPKDRKQVYAIIGAKAEAAGYDQKGFWAQMLGYAGKQMARAGDTVSTSFSDLAASGAVAEGASPERFAAGMEQRGARGVIYDELSDIASGVIDPVKPTVGWLNDSIETGLIKAPGSVAPFMLASAALGPIGGGALFTADFAEQNRRELVRSGMDDSKARLIGGAAAPLQAAVESLSNGLQLGRFPAVQAAMARLTKPIAGGAGMATRYGLNSLVSLGTEYTEEQVQDNVIRPVVQNIAAAFDQDVPHIGIGEIYDSIKKSSPDLLLTLAPMALVFGGAMTSAQANMSSSMIDSQDLLEAAGYSAAQANAIRTESTPEAKIAKARDFWTQREGTPQSMEEAAKSYTERLRILQTDTAAAQADLEQRGILPRMLHATDDRWRLTFNDGSVADFKSHGEADQARWQWANDQLGKVHLATREALSQMEKNAEVGREFAVEFKPDARFATDQEMQSPDFQQRVKQGEILDNPDASYNNSIAIAKASGDETNAVQILGSSVNQFKNNILTTTIKLYEGAHVLTLVEEKLEGDAKAILANQQGRDWMLSRLRAYEQASGDKLFATADDAGITDKMLVEGWSHLGQSYLVGQSKKGAALGKGGARRIFADVLNAGMGGEMNAETQFFNAVWRRAAKLGKAKREGKLGEDVVAELEKQLGIDSQVAHETEAAKEADAIANEALYAGGESYSEENPGPNGETFSLKKFFPTSGIAQQAAEVANGRQRGEASSFIQKAANDQRARTLPGIGKGAAAYFQPQRQVFDFTKAYDAAAVGQSSAMLSLDSLYEQAKKQVPGLTTQQFGQQVQALYKEGRLMLEPGDQPVSMKSALERYGLRDSLGIPSMFAAPMPTDQTFSIRPGDYASRMSAAFSPFQRSPELRAQLAQVAKARAMKLGAEWIDKAAVLRSTKDIGSEARMREALAYETRMQEYLDGLTPEARQTLEYKPTGIKNDPLVSAMLDFGNLMSRSTAMKAGKIDKKAGDYDGVPRLPPSWYSKGSGIMPDVMAQAMHDAGLLKDGHTGTLWDELGKRLAAASKDKAAYTAAQTAYKAAEKYARTASRAEADQWAVEAKKKATSPQAQREMLKAALRTLDGILSAAPPEVRAKVGGYIKIAGLATDEAMLKEIENRIEKLNVELEKWLKKDALERVKSLLKKGRPSTESGKKAKGKDADMHSLFAAAEAATKLDEAGVAGRLAELDTRIASGELSNEQEVLALQERGLVELLGDIYPRTRDSGKKDKNGDPIFERIYDGADSGRIYAGIDALQSIYDGAWLKWKLAQIERREQRAGMRHEFITDTGKTGVRKERTATDGHMQSLIGGVKKAWLSISSFHEALSYAFGESSERVKSLVDGERQASNQYEDVNQSLADEVESLFAGIAGSRLAGQKLHWQMAQPTIETDRGSLSPLQAIQAKLMWAQEDGQRHMEGPMDENGKPLHGKWNYDQAWIDKVTAELSPEALRVMSWLMQKYQGEWATLNPLYRQRYGVNLPAHDNYAPITVAPAQSRGGETIDPVTGATVASGSILTPGSLRTRNRSAIAEPEFRDALQTYIGHSRQLEYWKAYYDLATEASAILGNREVMNAVHAAAGKDAADVLRKWVDAIAQGGFRDSASALAVNKGFSKMMSRAATTALLGRVGTLLVQSTQLAAAAVKMPLGSYVWRFGKLWAGLLPGINSPNIWKDSVNSPFIQRRYKTAPPIVRQAMEAAGEASKPNAIKGAVRHLGNLLSGADALFTAGTYAMLLDYHRQTGAELGLAGAELEEFAHTEAERATEQVAQPTRMTARSLFEVTNTSPLGRTAWAFASESRQKLALFGWAAMNAGKDPAYTTKVAFLTFGVGGLLSQVIKNLWKEAKGDDNESKWSVKALLQAAFVRPFSGFPGVSEMLGEPGMLSRLTWTQKSVKDMAQGDGDLNDAANILGALGMFNDNAAAVSALSNAGIDAAKVIENASK